jgi:uncharacterized protein
MNEGVFLETSGLYAIFQGEDVGHQAASGMWNDLIDSGAPLHTSDFVLLELSALLQRRLGLAAVDALNTYVVPWTNITWMTETLYTRGVSGVLAARRRDLSLVDCTSFAIMRSLGLRKVFTFDPHFAEQGFEVLPAAAS